MKKTIRLKTLVLFGVMALGMLLPATMYAQGGNDNMFQVDDAFSGNRDITTTWVLINNGIGQSEAPLGSGLLILGAAGAGYVLAKRRHSRKGMTLVLALALMLSTTQCKKNVETISDAATNGVYITLNVGGDEKVGVDPTNGGSNDYAKVTWETDDVIYVGNNGAYCGFLKYDGEKFAGTINPTSADDADYLHFYFMGNKGPEGNPTGNYSITDQTEKYPVISYGRSTSLYNAGTTSYSTTLFNKCAIVKFATTDINADITITGMNNMVSVDFSKNKGAGDPVNPFTYTKDGEGSIKLHKESNTERWAILLPQDEVTTATASASGYETESAFTVPAITANMYHNSDVTVTLIKLSYIDAEFTVAPGTTVKFSKGNLQYNKLTDKFSFMEHQYSTVETYMQDVGQDYADQNIVSLFGWGTSGYDNKYPFMTSQNNSDYGNGNDIAGTDYDWGVYNKQSNQNKIEDGGDHAWRILTRDEWVWVLGSISDADPGTNCRTSSTVNGVANARFAKATVNSESGVIIFPDSYTHPDEVTQPTNINDYTNNYSGNTYDTTQWSSMEAAGCVFLPAAGIRDGLTVNDAGSRGFYWSGSSHGSNTNVAYYVYFSSGYLNPQYYRNKYYGFSVRLVYQVER